MPCFRQAYKVLAQSSVSMNNAAMGLTCVKKVSITEGVSTGTKLCATRPNRISLSNNLAARSKPVWVVLVTHSP